MQNGKILLIYIWLILIKIIFSDDEEKKSLTGHSRGESETDSMAEYGDGDPGRFTEDGSFIGMSISFWKSHWWIQLFLGQYGAQAKGLINDKPWIIF